MITKNGKSEGNIALKNNLAPEIVYLMHTFGVNIIWRIIREQINVIDRLIFNVLNSLNNNNIIKINDIVNNNFNVIPLKKYYYIKYILIFINLCIRNNNLNK